MSLRCMIVLAGGKNDDNSRGYFWHLLAAVPSVFPASDHHADQPLPVYTADIPRYILDGHEQLYVQPSHLLLDERKVSI